MSIGKVIAYISAAILIFFGVLFIWGAFSPQGTPGWIIIGLITIVLGFGILWLAGRVRVSPADRSSEVSLKLDLPGEVKLDSLKCQSCGGVLSSKHITMVAGAPIVNCPYCGSSYQLTEQPKW